jgi:hypothetical protein
LDCNEDISTTITNGLPETVWSYRLIIIILQSIKPIIFTTFPTTSSQYLYTPPFTNSLKEEKKKKKKKEGKSDGPTGINPMSRFVQKVVGRVGQESHQFNTPTQVIGSRY